LFFGNSRDVVSLPNSGLRERGLAGFEAADALLQAVEEQMLSRSIFVGAGNGRLKQIQKFRR
jgi:hypothetical protein